MSETRDWRAGAALAGAALLVSLPGLIPYHAHPLPTWWQDWIALVLGLAAALPLLVPRRGERITVPWISIGFVAFAGVLVLQVAIGRVTYAETSALGIACALWAALVAMAGWRLREMLSTYRAATLLQAALAAGGFGAAMLGIMQFYGLELAGFALAVEGEVQGMVGATGQRNYFALIEACGLASIAFLWVRGRTRGAIALAAGAPMAAALALSGSRSAWLYAAIMLGCLAWRGGARARTAIAAIATALAIGAWLPLPPGQVETGASRLLDPIADSPRLTLARYAWDIFQTAPLLGAGWGEFSWRAAEMCGHPPPPPCLLDRHAHNLGVQLLAETGAIGAAAILAPLAAWWVALLRGWPRYRGRRIAPVQIHWLLAIAAMHASLAMLELPHWQLYLLGPAALLLGLGARSAPAFTVPAGWRWAGPALLALSLAGAAQAMADYRRLAAWVSEAQALERAARGGPLEIPVRLLVELEGLAGTLLRPQAELIAAQIPLPAATAADLAAQIALTGRALHQFPVPGVAERRAELLRQAAQGAFTAP